MADAMYPCAPYTSPSKTREKANPKPSTASAVRTYKGGGEGGKSKPIGSNEQKQKKKKKKKERKSGWGNSQIVYHVAAEAARDGTGGLQDRLTHA